MRNAFVAALTAQAERDPRIVLLTADLGYKIFDDFARRCPGRFMNVGVAEANMAGVAAGLALDGLRPFIYSIVPFATLRAYEQIRNDVCYQNLDVKVVGVGGGYSYGPNGPTHHALEDVGALRLLPHLAVVCPGDPAETVAAVDALCAHVGPGYLRLGRAGEPRVHPGPVSLRLGEALSLRDGGEVALLSTGNMLASAAQAADLLAARGVGCRLLSVPCVKPLDEAAVERAARQTRLVVTVEEHYRAGGLGGAVAELLSGLRGVAPLRRLGAGDDFAHACGEQAWHRRRNGLLPEQIAETVLEALRDLAR